MKTALNSFYIKEEVNIKAFVLIMNRIKADKQEK
jgi:hypothetical protein